MKLEFKPEDFEPDEDGYNAWHVSNQAQDIHDKWLAEQGRVYAYEVKEVRLSATTPWLENPVQDPTHQAYLVDVRPIEASCAHDIVVTQSRGFIFKAICRKCNANYSPKKWEIV